MTFLFFLMWTIFKVFIEVVKNIASVLCVFFFFYFLCRLLAPWPENKPAPCIGRQSLNHWTTSACVLHRFSHFWLFVTLWTIALQAPPFVRFSWQEYWSELPCPSPGDLPDPGNPRILCFLLWLVLYHLGSPTGPPGKSPTMTFWFHTLWKSQPLGCCSSNVFDVAGIY